MSFVRLFIKRYTTHIIIGFNNASQMPLQQLQTLPNQWQGSGVCRLKAIAFNLVVQVYRLLSVSILAHSRRSVLVKASMFIIIDFLLR